MKSPRGGVPRGARVRGSRCIACVPSLASRISTPCLAHLDPGVLSVQVGASSIVTDGDGDGVADADCDPGSFSLSGAWMCDACPEGSYQPATQSTACLECSEGSYCLERSPAPIACPPGSFSNESGASACVACAVGRYQSATGATACDVCDAGGWCGEGASAVTLCDSGHYRNTTGGGAVDVCLVCGPGFACARGTVQRTKCLPGSFSLNGDFCDACAPGEFQDEAGGSACETCTRGFYCPAGSGAGLP